MTYVLYRIVSYQHIWTRTRATFVPNLYVFHLWNCFNLRYLAMIQNGCAMAAGCSSVNSRVCKPSNTGGFVLSCIPRFQTGAASPCISSWRAHLDGKSWLMCFTNTPPIMYSHKHTSAQIDFFMSLSTHRVSWVFVFIQCYLHYSYATSAPLYCIKPIFKRGSR